LTSRLKSHHCTTFLQYLGKYAFVRHATSLHAPILIHMKAAIWNSLVTDPGWWNFDIGNVFCIIVRYSLKLRSLVQYFFVFGKSIFLHFPSIWNQFIEIVPGRVSLPSLTSPLKSHHCTTLLQYLAKYAFVRLRFWEVPYQTNPNLLNKWHLKFACAYLNTQESSPSGTPLKRLQDVRYSMKLSGRIEM
ncbi:hypothetical protein T06_1158, partial [Trichinella sp. T6]